MKYAFGYLPYHIEPVMIGSFIGHTINAYSVGDGRHAGYIKIAYIPSGTADTDIYEFLCVTGRLSSFGTNDNKVQTIVEGAWNLLLDSGIGWIEANDAIQYIKKLNQQDAYNFIMKEIMPSIEKKKKREWREFIQYHVDKPRVDFIRVHEGYNGTGLAEQLYYRAGVWMQKQFNLPFRFSTLQCGAAKKVMQRFINHDMVETRKEGKCIMNWLKVDKPLWIQT